MHPFPQHLKATGLHYHQFFSEIHQKFHFDWYMEIGCQSGKSLAHCHGKTIAVDPYFRASTNIIGKKERLHVFQSTSDDFFKTDFLKKNEISLSFSFLDGMHVIDFLLRDFINTEKNSMKNGVIAVHDCCPYSVEMTTTDLSNIPDGAWTGDIWKIIPILQEYRKDLKIEILDCSTTGLLVISNLDPDNTVLEVNTAEILKKFQNITILEYGLDKYFSGLAFKNAASFLHEPNSVFSGAITIAEPAFTPKLHST